MPEMDKQTNHEEYQPLMSVHGRCLLQYYDEESGLTLLAGDRVGAGRWPYCHAHPGIWGLPHIGIVLPLNHKSVWRSSDHYSYSLNRFVTQKEIDDHVVRCLAEGLLPPSRVPVLWLFSNQKQVVYMGTVGLGRYDVKPYELDLKMWLEARRQAYDLEEARLNKKVERDQCVSIR